MGGVNPVLLVAGGITVVLIGGLLLLMMRGESAAAKGRRLALIELARALALTPQPREGSSLGVARTHYPVLAGARDGVPVTMHFQEGQSASSTRIAVDTQTAFTAQITPPVGMGFGLGPRDRLAEKLGAADAGVRTGDPAIDEHFRVYGEPAVAEVLRRAALGPELTWARESRVSISVQAHQVRFALEGAELPSAETASRLLDAVALVAKRLARAAHG